MTKTVWLLITAHPDDESMFFIPTLRSLLNTINQANIKTVAADADGRRPSDDISSIQLLCLSNGDYRDASDGPIRTKEMYRACSLIGVGNRKDSAATVTVLDENRMKDGPNEVWSCDLVSETVLEHIRKRVAPIACADGITSSKPKRDCMLSDPSKETQSWVFMEKKTVQSSKSGKESKQTINLNLLTFDQCGVSRHPNHVDTFRGVQYLLNEKCYVTRDKVEPMAMAKLWLCHERHATKNDADTDSIEFNISVHTLRTISNPLQKYFLWVFVDIIPFLFMWLFEMLWHLVYFLIGGLTWSKGGPQPIQQFSMTKTTSDGSNMQCRIMDPILVWMAMAAHHSQFVWYRRLSVIFSRYTYINDLQQLPIDQPLYDDGDDEEDDIASLPPVVTMKEEETSPKFILDPPQIDALREAVLPAGLHHRPWKRIYSLSRDGDSFVAFQKIMEDWSRRQGGQSTLLIVKASGGDMVGGFADVPIPLVSNSTDNASRSCLFKLQVEKECEEPVVKVYGKDCFSSSKKILFSGSRRMVAFGGGYSDGLDEGFGLCLSDGFARGTTARCMAFRNEPLVSDKDGVFEVLDVEVWGFVFGQF
mmetsp:Transcript_43944/g.93546  ORF Transcript_43944/g.93546 Transcript_43944/m.93546 type:complete len:590 (-) Transcript_43944:288-2057(-)